MGKFTFKTTKQPSGSYWTVVRRNGEELFTRIGSTRKDALAQAKLDAEAYGWIDGI